MNSNLWLKTQTLNLKLKPPLRLLSPFAREHCDGPGFIQTVVNQDFAARSVQAGYLDGVAPGVSPVHVPGHPVYSQSICGLQALADHRLHASAVQVCTPREQIKGQTIYNTGLLKRKKKDEKNDK